MPSDQPGFQLNIDFKIQPIRHFRPRTTRVKLTIQPEQTQNQQLPSKITRIPNR
jgi:hypothetical protein